MMDMFPFPSVKGGTPEEQVAELVSYLIQFKETLEFALMNISTENLSPDLVAKLESLGTDIVRNNEERESEVAQITTKALTVSDVCESSIFKLAVKDLVDIPNIIFSVNTTTGQLDYEIKEDE